MASRDPSDASGTAPASFPRRFWQLIYTHNPFYLLSVCFVVHGTSYWMQTTGGYRAWPLIGLVSGYILLLAGVAWAIVRLGQVWDDARSIFLILLLMFVELSLTLDDPLQTAPRIGIILVFAAFLFIVAVAEGLLHGLRIRLPWLLRVPFYLLLGLMMLFPLALTPRFSAVTAEQISWRIYGFFPLVGLAILTLVPSIRKKPAYTEDSGTPWPWPWYPWTLFAGLIAAVCVRGYALGLSFDPVLSLGTEAAMRLESAWGWYYLAPVVLAVGWLVLEFGLAGNNPKLQQQALLFPLVSIALSIPWFNSSWPFLEFLKIFTSTVGSPVFVALIGALVFYGAAFLRRVALSELGFALVLGLLAVVGPATLDWKTLTAPNAGPMGLAALVFLIRGYARSESVSALAGLLFGVAALRVSLPSEWPGFWQNALGLHLAGLAVLSVGVLFRDRLAGGLRMLGALLMVGGTVFALYGTAYQPADLPVGIIPGYVIGLVVLTLGVAYWLGSRVYLAAAGLSLGLGGSAVLRDIYHALRTLPEWPGIASFGLGFLLLLIGGAISAMKAGLGRRLKTLLSRPPIQGPIES